MPNAKFFSQENRAPPSFGALPSDEIISKQLNSNWQKGLLAQTEWIWSANLLFQTFPNNLGRYFLLIPGVFEKQLQYSTTLIFDYPSFINGIQVSGFLDRVLKELVVNFIAHKRRVWYSITHHSILAKLTFDKHNIDIDTFSQKMLNLENYYDDTNSNIFTKLEIEILKFVDFFTSNPFDYTSKDFNNLFEELKKYNQNTFSEIELPILRCNAAQLAEANAKLQKLNEQEIIQLTEKAYNSANQDFPIDLLEQKTYAQIVELAILCNHFVALGDMFTSLNIHDEPFIADTLTQSLPQNLIVKLDNLCKSGVKGIKPAIQLQEVDL